MEEVSSDPHPKVRLKDGTASYLHTDALGSVRAVTKADGAVEERAVYRPYGEKTSSVAPGAGEDKGWIGQRFDPAAGLQYLNARYYDPELGMFLQPDWFEVTRPGVGTNRFAYGLGDPVNLSDPGGNLVQAIPGAIARAALGYAARAAISYIAREVIGGSIVSTPIEDFDIGQESIPIDPTASEPTIHSTPHGDLTGAYVEGMSIDTNPGPTIHSTPATEQEIWSNVVEASALRGALGLKPKDGLIAHHNIPKEHTNLPAVEAAVRAGYKIDGAMNGTKVSGQQGGHPEYNRRIGRELDELFKDGQARGWTDEQYKDKVQEISDRERERIGKDGDYVYNK